MKDEIKRYIVVFILLFFSIFLILYAVKTDKKGNNKINHLVIFGDNIDTKYQPFMEGGVPYLSVDTVKKCIDEYIYYDKISTKVIVTTYNELIKMKINEKKISKNLEILDVEDEALIIDNEPFIPISLFTDIYDITITYNEETSTLSIDKKNEDDLKIKYNQVYVYEDIDTSSNVLEILNENSTVKVYDFEHIRWYKVRTEKGIVGYIAKNNIDINEKEEEKQQHEKSSIYDNKVVMFWQYGSDLTTLGDKIEGVNVVSPTWYELKNSTGEISSKFSKLYYDKAKYYGYEIWPLISNGIDNANYSSLETSKFLNSEANRENFIKNILKIATDNKFEGINIDFESMKTEDKEMYTQFIRELCPVLRQNNIKVSVDLYFVAYIERGKVGAAADYVILMGYDQRGNWSSEAGSISEISWVEQNINSLIEDSKIEPYKIILGVPFYTRLWVENNANDSLTTKVYSMKNCNEFLKSNNLEKKLDETSGQNYAEYTKGNTTYKLWIEDSDSINKRVDIINKYGLSGISGWQKGLETDDVWSTIVNNIK